MKQKRNYKQIRCDSKDYFAGLAKQIPDKKASERFRRPAAYQACALLRGQGHQMEHKTVEQYLAEKYDIGGEDVSANN